MPSLVPQPRTVKWIGRLAGCALAVGLGTLTAALLLAAARPAWAATAQIRPYPGGAPCDTSLQACIDGASPGDTIVIQPNTYYTSVTLSQAVSLTGVSSATVILNALPAQRVLTATGAVVDSSVVISGLTFTGGSELGFLGSGGGMLLRNGAQPRLENIRVINNQASFVGGGIFGQSVRLVNSVVQSNTAAVSGGGIATLVDATLVGSRLEANTCTLDGCQGGGLYASTAILTGTTFYANTARMNGGGLMANTAATMTGGLLQQNACTQIGCIGGGLMTSGTLSLTGAAFISNTADFHGGGAYVVSTTAATGGLFQGNSWPAVDCFGGGLHTTGALFAASTVFTGNTAHGGGGGAAVFATATLTEVQMHGNRSTHLTCLGGGLFSTLTATVQGGQFVGNSCPSSGGGLYVGGLVLTDTLVMSNSAGAAGSGGSGGGAWAGQSATLSGGQFIGNYAAASGGGLVATSLTATNTWFVNNHCGGAGGGAAASSATVTGALFQGNSCQGYYGSSGGGLGASYAFVSNTDFISNAAQGNGGGLQAWINLTLTGTDFISNTTQAAGGGPIAAARRPSLAACFSTTRLPWPAAG